MLKNLPSFVWVILIDGGIAGLIGGIIGLFYLIANVEGFVSAIFLLIGIAYVRGRAQWARSADLVQTGQTEQSGQRNPAATVGNFATAAVIAFFALMGMAIDQPGNYIYNLPLDVAFCPAETSLERGVIVSHPLPERTDVTQNFSCVNREGEIEAGIGMEKVIAVRFVEYVFLGYFFLYLGRLAEMFVRSRRKRVSTIQT